jgi:thiol-disulfide isomerase/thioredoxin
MIINLSFYTTGGCHLCEEAKALLQQLLAKQPDKFQVEVVDIVASDELVERYGTRIPVVTKEGTQKDLGWPFDYVELQRFADDC